jgi:glycosyltransferase involved in cell wall biosynthesis
VAQLEFTQMAQYAPDCAPARTILVEHDITFDLYEQLVQRNEDWDLHRQLALWRRFEKEMWRKVDRVVVMSVRDTRTVSTGSALVLPNGVDVVRYRPADRAPETRRLLFLGSFRHQPNVLAVEFFLKEVWPLLNDVTLHIIAGEHHEEYLRGIDVPLAQPAIEVEGFVSDVRPAYERAALVVAPLIASAGTNIKILEAMAMGKAVVSTPAGVNGLELSPGIDFALVKTGPEMAVSIEHLLRDGDARSKMERAARQRVEGSYDWNEIARRQAELYRQLGA